MKDTGISDYKEKASHGDVLMPIQRYRCIVPFSYQDLSLHWHDEVEFTWIEGGSIDYGINFETYRVRKDDLLLISPHTLHSAHALKKEEMISESLVFHLDMLGYQTPDHLKHNLWHSENTVLFVGYQAEGTLGRALVDGAPSVKIFDEAIAVNAEIRVLAGVSGHADKNGLIRWLQGVSPKPAQIFVNHGDDEACTDFTQCLREEYGYNAMAPYSGTCYDLAAGAFLAQPAGVLRKKPEEAARDPRAMAAFSELQRAVKQLSALAQGVGGRPNKELKRMAAQVQALYDAWRA